MNYYNPNPNYFYGGMPQIYSQNTPYVPQPTIPSQTLNGKVVDSEEMVRATEVPLGSYGVFPKADLSEVYIKSWNNNGTTNIVTFKPTSIEEPKESDTSIILKKIENIENLLTATPNRKETNHEF